MIALRVEEGLGIISHNIDLAVKDMNDLLTIEMEIEISKVKSFKIASFDIRSSGMGHLNPESLEIGRRQESPEMTNQALGINSRSRYWILIKSESSAF